MSREGRWLAAVLAYGAGAVLSHLSAGALWRIVSRPGEHIDVTVPRRGGRKTRRGIRLHRSITLPPSHRMLLNAIPVTRPARTLEDLRRVLPAKQFAAALREAEYLGLPVGERFARDGTRSELERLFLGLCVRHRLPPPAVNVRIGRYTADFVWDEPGWSLKRMGGARIVVAWRSRRTTFATCTSRVAAIRSCGLPTDRSPTTLAALRACFGPYWPHETRRVCGGMRHKPAI